MISIQLLSLPCCLCTLSLQFVAAFRRYFVSLHLVIANAYKIPHLTADLVFPVPE